MSEASYVQLVELALHRIDGANVQYLMNLVDGIVIRRSNQILSSSL